MIPPFLAEKHGYRDGRRAERRAARRSCAAFLADRVSPDIAPAGSAMSSIRGCGCWGRKSAGGGRQRHAGGRQRQHQRAVIMIGEKAAEMIAAEHGVKLAEFVGERRSNSVCGRCGARCSARSHLGQRNRSRSRRGVKVMPSTVTRGRSQVCKAPRRCSAQAVCPLEAGLRRRRNAARTPQCGLKTQ